MIRELGRHDKQRISFLNEVQDIVNARFSTSAIETRFPEWQPERSGNAATAAPTLSIASKSFRRTVMENVKDRLND
ncbi:hypothetical protein N4R57_19855 [Rhodobacteraceae bacterium D3-12]|nr:hypothetical protein N4R57_19855 [Rhodobacteraceae bacterium D3-12]